ncbi:polysaccharide biosynthesis/export family protein [Luteolibacter marinus]|uniref:polysaccharide biosynthesis/export family protein n=1 Tax=Luteolibacter marinus TaxID=2776705 RepID=UPI0018677ED7|nr:SLBB domain-containing protein [Luteolibacter marinus]
MNSNAIPRSLLLLAASACPLFAGLEPGDGIQLTLRGVGASEQEIINGNYRVGESGKVRLPLLDDLVTARGLTPEEFARAAESAYQAAGIYTKPAIDVEAISGKEIGDKEAIVSVGGQVRRAGEAEFRKGMTVIQALDAAGGRTDFGSRNLILIRGEKQYCLDFEKLRHKNIRLLPDDSLQVEQKGLIDRWHGNDAAVAPLLD